MTGTWPFPSPTGSRSSARAGSSSSARRRKSGRIKTRASGNSFTRKSHPSNPIDTMKESVESKLGFFFALAIFCAFIILESLGGFAFLHRGYHLHALFKNVQELKVGDFVKMAGVQIGRVESISLSNSFAEVTLNLNREAAVKTD